MTGRTAAMDAWIADIFGVDPADYDLASPVQGAPDALQSAAPKSGGAPPTPPGPPPKARSHISEKELNAWRKARPKAVTTEIGVGLTAKVRAKYTHKYLRDSGFVMAGAMNIGGGGSIEYWINDTGGGREIDVWRDPMWPDTKTVPEEPPDIDDQQQADDDLSEAKTRVGDSNRVRKELSGEVQRLLAMPKGPKFDEAVAAFQQREVDWLQELETNIERIQELERGAPTAVEKEELSNDLYKLFAYFQLYSIGWEGRDQLPIPPP